MKYFHAFMETLMLVHETVSIHVVRPILVRLCNCSGKDNYFWSVATFWVSLAVLLMSGFIMIPLILYIVAPFIMIGSTFFPPRFAEKLKKSEGSVMPIEMLYVKIQGASLLVIVFSCALSLVWFHDVRSILEVLGYVLTYMSLCFLIDRQSGGKSLVKRAKEKARNTSKNLQGKTGSDTGLPQPI
ncbi:hypothetical protein HY004_02665 [Candidatus Saccharibacteria bacterium]|nr:hypothetical protein [Candidatus Saccharibacteria bacterium]